MNKLDALKGALVADAASKGLHWLYPSIASTMNIVP